LRNRAKISRMSAKILNSSLSLTPLGAGDLIDRAVRFYRNNFWTFVLIAAPPIVIGTIVSVGWTILGRQLFDFGEDAVTARVYQTIFTYFGNMFIWFFEGVAALIVMGGASRNFVRHILFDEKITFRETYSNVRKRLFGLLAASILLVFLFTLLFFLTFQFGASILMILVFIVIAATGSFPLLSTIFSIAIVVAGVFGLGWLFFLVISRFTYVPQVMMVEGQSVFAAIGRSTGLASKNVKRLAALFVFTTVAIFSAMSLFYVPLGWYAYVSGVNLSPFAADELPAWYEIANQLVSQASFILLVPVWMIGLCLLYVDERVRHEGYDIELMAARSLGEIPSLPQNYSNPLQPALASQILVQPPPNPPSRNNDYTTLGLN
jgi:hypothetical protein